MKPSEPQTVKADAARLPLVAPGMRIGLLGGSFDPAHEAHREISLTALKRLGLDRVWWVVTPQNPLKTATRPASLEARVAGAKRMANHPRIAVTGFSAGSRYTIDLLTALKRRFPGVNFVWLMGADNLAQLHRWRSWEEIFALVPIAVVDRPGFRLKARAGRAAQRFSAYMVDDSDAAGLARLIPPAWTMLTHRLSALSSTALRAKKAKKAKQKQAKKAKQKEIKRAKQKEVMKAQAKKKKVRPAAGQAKPAKPDQSRGAKKQAKKGKKGKKAESSPAKAKGESRPRRNKVKKKAKQH
ncbi:MAG: nicotinate-nucleotide adenylyltransferase [Methyloceanibacter sp.]